MNLSGIAMNQNNPIAKPIAIPAKSYCGNFGKMLTVVNDLYRKNR